MLGRFMNFEEMLETADKAVFAQTGKHLNEAEMKVLEGAWQKKDYSQMAEDCGYSVSYLKRDIGPRLWKLLSEALGEEVSKRNFRAALERKLLFAGDSVQVAPTSNFYVERFPVEKDCHTEIKKPGSLIRIKAPKQMGKTLLMNNILEAAKTIGYRPVYLDLLLADEENLKDVNKFLHWFCATADKLQPNSEYKKHSAMDWDETLGSKLCCTEYFEEHLLTDSLPPLVLGVDNIDRVFSHLSVANDFFALLRAWHEKPKIADNWKWKNLRLVVAHSTEVYIPLKIEQSPFNVGVPIELPEFTSKEIEDLAKRYGLPLDKSKVEQMMASIGGHPFLVSLALAHLVQAEMNQPEKNQLKNNLVKLLETADTEVGLYKDHLREHLWNLKQDKELFKAMSKVVLVEDPVRLETMQAFKLDSMGLVRWEEDNKVKPRCKVYRDYFSRYFKDHPIPNE